VPDARRIDGVVDLENGNARAMRCAARDLKKRLELRGAHSVARTVRTNQRSVSGTNTCMG
jgi:hypothetical protein